MAEADARLEMKTVAVRPAMTDAPVHGAQQALIDGAPPRQVHDASDAAHQAVSVKRLQCML